MMKNTRNVNFSHAFAIEALRFLLSLAAVP